MGPGARDETGKFVPLNIKAGDRVLFGKWSGTEVKIDGEDLLTSIRPTANLRPSSAASTTLGAR